MKLSLNVLGKLYIHVYVYVFVYVKERENYNAYICYETM